jgi:3-dehydroquinate dehydratase
MEDLVAERGIAKTIILGRPGVSTRTLGSGLKIAVPVLGSSRSQIADGWNRAAEAGADIIEWRVDEVLDPELETLGIKLRDHFAIPVIVTLRTDREGGCFQSIGHEAEYGTRLRQAAHWADAVDVEIDMPDSAELIGDVQSNGAVAIASRHVLEGAATETRLKADLLEMVESGAEIVKIAWMISSPTEVAAIRSVQEWAYEELAVPAVVLGMGDLGRTTRVGDAARLLAFSFAHVGNLSAPGQPSIEEMR